jgi:hypothetical protein
MQHETPRSLNGNILNARNRLGRSVLAIVADDFASHNELMVQRLREQNLAAYARLVSDGAALKRLVTECVSTKDPAPLPHGLDARSGLGQALLEAIARDFAAHGQQAIAQLREANPVAYARLIGEAIHFKALQPERTPRRDHEPRRKPRPLRMKELLKEMEDQPIDVNNPILPAKHRDRWLEAVKALHPRMPWDLTPNELRESWGEDLAAWFEKNCRAGRPEP